MTSSLTIQPSVSSIAYFRLRWIRATGKIIHPSSILFHPRNCSNSYLVPLTSYFFNRLFSIIFFFTYSCVANAQSYTIKYQSTETDSVLLTNQEPLQTSFASRSEASIYIFQLPAMLQAKGFITSSVDSVHYDSLFAIVHIYMGEQYKWARINTRAQDDEILRTVRWPSSFEGPVDFITFQAWQKNILDHLEENGHPFAKVYLDSIMIVESQIKASLIVDKGPLYKIDSIRIHGNANVKNDFIQRYLQITNGSIYNKKKLQAVSKKLSEISYIQEERPFELSLLGTGSILNLYLKSRKSSQANVLVGFLPNSDQLSGNKKFLLTVDANILLRNALGGGETIGLVWQQLQKKSPRLNLIFDQPYIFRSDFGVHFTLDMYKRDSVFLNINMDLGTSYRIEERQSASVFLQRRQTIVTGINTASIIQSRSLPREIDVSSVNLGFGYNFNNTDFRFNPTKGIDFSLSSSAGNKKIRKNNQIIELKDPNDATFKFDRLYDTVKLKAYQFRVTASFSRFFPLGSQSTVKLGTNAGIYQSANFFRNELFQIGGFKLLRGFDEESQFVSQYAIGTVEYRLRAGASSYFFAFVDGGAGKHILETKPGHSYFGTGLGLSFETKSSIINLAWAIGKRDDTEINLRQSKLHLGFASYF